MISDFADEATRDIFNGENTRNARKIPQELWGLMRRKMDRLNGAQDIRDLLDPPGNRLEKLLGRLKGKYSIRINSQYRLVFQFENGTASEVQVADYH